MREEKKTGIWHDLSDKWSLIPPTRQCDKRWIKLKFTIFFIGLKKGERSYIDGM